jgi:hypothetical protein
MQTTLDQTLKLAAQLSIDQQDMLIDILQRRRVDQRREEIAKGIDRGFSCWQTSASTFGCHCSRTAPLRCFVTHWELTHEVS